MEQERAAVVEAQRERDIAIASLRRYSLAGEDRKGEGGEKEEEEERESL